MRISQSKDQPIAKNTKSDRCKMLNRRHKLKVFTNKAQKQGHLLLFGNNGGIKK